MRSKPVKIPSQLPLLKSTKNKDQRNKTNNNDVTRHHVGEQPNDQRKWFCENAQDLNRHHDELYTQRHRRLENMPPIMFIGADIE